MSEHAVGSVRELWRYPVKSMRGECMDCLDVAAAGVAGDRAYALRDAEGRLGSGKRTARFGRIDGLLELESRYAGEQLEILLPDGDVIEGRRPDIDAVLSARLGQAVTLVHAHGGEHLDDAPVHLLSTSGLAWLSAALPASRIDARRFRPNLVIDTPGDRPAEPAWTGRTLRIGETLTLSVIGPTERCGMVALGQGELPRDPAVLRAITQQAGLCFGVYARVAAPGRVCVDDAVVFVDED